MKIYTHWVYDPDTDLHTKKFFGTKGEQNAAIKAAEDKGKQIVNKAEYSVTPNAKGIALFCNEHTNITFAEECPGDDEESIDELI